MHRRAKLAACIVLTCLWTGRAPADEYHYQNVLIGERAVGMGGAATAVADDAAAAYYNPAGLVQSGQTSMSLSATLLQARLQSMGGFLGQEGVAQTSLSIVASSWSYAMDLWGGRFAFSILVPDSYDFEMDQEVVDGIPPPLTAAHLIRNRRDDTYLAGPSMGWRLSEDWAWGFSLYMFYRSYNFRQDDTYVYQTGALTQMVDTESGNSLGIRPQLGLLWRPLPELQFGLLTRLGAAFQDNGSRRRLRVESTPTTPDVFVRTVSGESFGVDGDEQVETRVPGSMTAGVAWLVTPSILLSLDGSYYGGVSYQRLGRDVRKEATWNVALGAEFVLCENWPLRVGFFTNHSAAPEIDHAAVSQIDPATYTLDNLPPDRIDHYGFSISLGRLTPQSTIDVALQMMLGVGERVEVIETGAAVYPMADLAVHLTISGSYIFYESDPDREQRG